MLPPVVQDHDEEGTASTRISRIEDVHVVRTSVQVTIFMRSGLQSGVIVSPPVMNDNCYYVSVLKHIPRYIYHRLVFQVRVGGVVAEDGSAYPSRTGDGAWCVFRFRVWFVWGIALVPGR